MKLGYFIFLLIISMDVFSAADLSVFPVRIFLGPGHIRDVLNVANNSNKVVSVQAKSFLWAQEDGVDKLQNSQELIVVPSIFKMEPGETQALRVGFRRSPLSDKESTYRILLTEVPTDTQENNDIGVRLQLSLPLFYRPNKTGPKIDWSLVKIDADRAWLEARNEGDAHLLINKVGFKQGSGVSESWEQEGLFYILSDSVKKWQVPTNGSSGDKKILLEYTESPENIKEQILLLEQI